MRTGRLSHLLPFVLLSISLSPYFVSAKAQDIDPVIQRISGQVGHFPVSNIPDSLKANQTDPYADPETVQVIPITDPSVTPDEAADQLAGVEEPAVAEPVVDVTLPPTPVDNTTTTTDDAEVTDGMVKKLKKKALAARQEEDDVLESDEVDESDFADDDEVIPDIKKRDCHEDMLLSRRAAPFTAQQQAKLLAVQKKSIKSPSSHGNSKQHGGRHSNYARAFQGSKNATVSHAKVSDTKINGTTTIASLLRAAHNKNSSSSSTSPNNVTIASLLRAAHARNSTKIPPAAGTKNMTSPFAKTNGTSSHKSVQSAIVPDHQVKNQTSIFRNGAAAGGKGHGYVYQPAGLQNAAKAKAKKAVTPAAPVGAKTTSAAASPSLSTLAGAVGANGKPIVVTVGATLPNYAMPTGLGQSGNTPTTIPWLCQKQYNPTLKGCTGTPVYNKRSDDDGAVDETDADAEAPVDADGTPVFTFVDELPEAIVGPVDGDGALEEDVVVPTEAATEEVNADDSDAESVDSDDDEDSDDAAELKKRASNDKNNCGKKGKRCYPNVQKRGNGTVKCKKGVCTVTCKKGFTLVNGACVKPAATAPTVNAAATPTSSGACTIAGNTTTLNGQNITLLNMSDCASTSTIAPAASSSVAVKVGSSPAAEPTTSVAAPVVATSSSLPPFTPPAQVTGTGSTGGTPDVIPWLCQTQYNPTLKGCTGTPVYNRKRSVAEQMVEEAGQKMRRVKRV